MVLKSLTIACAMLLSVTVAAHGPTGSLSTSAGAHNPITDGAVAGSGTSQGDLYPVRRHAKFQRAYAEHPHVEVAKSCPEPRGFRRMEIKAGRNHARSGEVYGYAPRVIRVEPCEEIEVAMVTDDEVRHSFMVPGLNPMPNLEFIGPGKRSIRFIAPNRDITMAFHCHTSQHEKHGMSGWLIVGSGGMPADGDASAEKTFEGEGTVVAVKPRQGMVVIAHDEIAGLMGAMTMAFKTSSADQIQTAKPGKRVRFTLDAMGRTLRGVTAIDESGGDHAMIMPASAKHAAGKTMPMAKAAGTHVKGRGKIVAKIAARGQLVIDHGDLPGYMDAMTMGFGLMHPKLIDSVAEGDEVRFTVDTATGKIVTLAKIEAAAGGLVDVEGIVIVKLAERGQLLIEHDDIPGMMKAMTMAFTLADPKLADSVEVGERIRFTLRKADNVIVAIEKAKTEGKKQSDSLIPDYPGLAPEAVTYGRDLDGDGDADEIDIRLEVVEIEDEIWPGKKLNIWAFAPPSHGMTSPARLPSPTLRVEQGDRVRLTLHNTHYLPHTLHLHGAIHPNAMDGVPAITQEAIPPGGSFTYEFIAKNPGTHQYHCHVQPDIHVPMGMAGMLIIEENRPNNDFSALVIGAGAITDMAKATAERYDREYSLVYSDVDERLNNIPLMSRGAAETSRKMHREYDSTQRNPGIFLLNGRAFPYTLRDTPIVMKPDERIKLRILNAGAHVMSLHTHGHRGIVTHIDGNPVPERARVPRDVFTLTAARRLDIELRPGNDDVYSSGPGVWVLHDHDEKATTSQGINPGGNITAMVYEEYLDADGNPKTATSLDRYFDPRYYRGELPVFGGELFAPTEAPAPKPVVEGTALVLATELDGLYVTLDHDPIPGVLGPVVANHMIGNPSTSVSLKAGDQVRYAYDKATEILTILEKVAD